MIRVATPWQPGELDELDRVYQRMTEGELLDHFADKTIGQIRGKAIRRNLTRPAEGVAMRLDPDHRAAVVGHTIFPRQVRAPADALRLLVPGRDQRKIGGRVTRGGQWSGFPIYTLTLEERATCPRTCHHWLTCYGNAMQWSVRIDAGAPGFEDALDAELAELDRVHPAGFVVRLHVLGDFPSVAYVQRWARWLIDFPALHVFGYTAHPPSTPIGGTIARLAALRWDRFAVRLSSTRPGPRRAVTAFLAEPPALSGVVTCPAERHHPDGTRQTQGCGTCGLCWRAPELAIRFIAHGGRRGRKPA